MLRVSHTLTAPLILLTLEAVVERVEPTDPAEPGVHGRSVDDVSSVLPSAPLPSTDVTPLTVTRILNIRPDTLLAFWKVPKLYPMHRKNAVIASVTKYVKSKKAKYNPASYLRPVMK